MINFFSTIGRYFLFVKKVFSYPEKLSTYYKRTIDEFIYLGLKSIGIVAVISVFIGAVITIQTAYNLENPMLPTYLIGLATRDSLILEFSSTIVALILAGKVGSSIASEIGTMRVTEQIDALDIMGVNSAGFLVLPKIIAMVLFNPFLAVLSMVVGISGGLAVAFVTDIIPVGDYLTGLQFTFNQFYVTYSLIKTLFFGFVIASVPAFYGYYVRGGSLEVGKASTRAVVNSTVIILMLNLILTKLFLS
ncbi:MAG: ABC transporter permease [Bacteroidales bacterium]|jgi:phospholipid/cholesterol/gamma-HCH transport system permease protein|nr:ABC transporter permease [Bacteroidales bacterium]